MIINLDDIYFLDCDERCVILTERRLVTGENTSGIKAKAENIGKEREIQHGFYGSIAQACEKYMKLKAASFEGVLSAAELIKAWKEAVDRIETVCKTLPKRGL